MQQLQAMLLLFFSLKTIEILVFLYFDQVIF